VGIGAAREAVTASRPTFGAEKDNLEPAARKVFVGDRLKDSGD
jgi:hypothetical protein